MGGRRAQNLQRVRELAGMLYIVGRHDVLLPPEGVAGRTLDPPLCATTADGHAEMSLQDTASGESAMQPTFAAGHGSWGAAGGGAGGEAAAEAAEAAAGAGGARPEAYARGLGDLSRFAAYGWAARSRPLGPQFGAGANVDRVVRGEPGAVWSVNDGALSAAGEYDAAGSSGVEFLPGWRPLDASGGSFGAPGGGGASFSVADLLVGPRWADWAAGGFVEPKGGDFVRGARALGDRREHRVGLQLPWNLFTATLQSVQYSFQILRRLRRAMARWDDAPSGCDPLACRDPSLFPYWRTVLSYDTANWLLRGGLSKRAIECKSPAAAGVLRSSLKVRVAAGTYNDAATGRSQPKFGTPGPAAGYGWSHAEAEDEPRMQFAEKATLDGLVSKLFAAGGAGADFLRAADLGADSPYSKRLDVAEYIESGLRPGGLSVELCVERSRILSAQSVARRKWHDWAMDDAFAQEQAGGRGSRERVSEESRMDARGEADGSSGGDGTRRALSNAGRGVGVVNSGSQQTTLGMPGGAVGGTHAEQTTALENFRTRVADAARADFQELVAGLCEAYVADPAAYRAETGRFVAFERKYAEVLESASDVPGETWGDVVADAFLREDWLAAQRRRAEEDRLRALPTSAYLSEAKRSAAAARERGGGGADAAAAAAAAMYASALVPLCAHFLRPNADAKAESRAGREKTRGGAPLCVQVAGARHTVGRIWEEGGVFPRPDAFASGGRRDGELAPPPRTDGRRAAEQHDTAVFKGAFRSSQGCLETLLPLRNPWIFRDGPRGDGRSRELGAVPSARPPSEQLAAMLGVTEDEKALRGGLPFDVTLDPGRGQPERARGAMRARQDAFVVALVTDHQQAEPRLPGQWDYDVIANRWLGFARPDRVRPGKARMADSAFGDRATYERTPLAVWEYLVQSFAWHRELGAAAAVRLVLFLQQWSHIWIEVMHPLDWSALCGRGIHHFDRASVESLTTQKVHIAESAGFLPERVFLDRAATFLREQTVSERSMLYYNEYYTTRMGRYEEAYLDVGATGAVEVASRYTSTLQHMQRQQGEDVYRALGSCLGESHRPSFSGGGVQLSGNDER